MEDLDPDKGIVIDLRDKRELNDTGVIPGAVHIPLIELRRKLPELDREKNYIVYCAIGMRGYIAHRILTQNGFKSMNLSGGFRTYGAAVK
jgi:rhodanese-related sulfurtransferase